MCCVAWARLVRARFSWPAPVAGRLGRRRRTTAPVRPGRGAARRSGWRPVARPCRWRGPVRRAAPRRQAALREAGLLRLAFELALLLAAGAKLALGVEHALAQLRLALLAVGQLHVQFLEAGLGARAALLQFG